LKKILASRSRAKSTKTRSIRRELDRRWVSPRGASEGCKRVNRSGEEFYYQGGEICKDSFRDIG